MEDVEDEGEGDELEEVDPVCLAVLEEIVEEAFFIGELVVVLEVVQRVLEDAVVDAVLVLVALVRLLPTQVYEQLLPVPALAPIAPSRKHPPHQLSVVAAADEETAAVVLARCDLALGDGVRPAGRGPALVDWLREGEITLRMMLLIL